MERPSIPRISEMMIPPAALSLTLPHLGKKYFVLQFWGSDQLQWWEQGRERFDCQWRLQGTLDDMSTWKKQAVEPD